jgi:PAS domain S-box-containing protein
MGAERTSADHHRFRRLVDSLDHAIVWEFDDTLKAYTFVSDHSRLVLGYDCQDWLNNSNFFEDHIEPEDLPRVLEMLDKLRRREATDLQLQHRCLRADGRVIWVHSGVHFEEEDGHELFRGVTIDIDDLKLTEQRERDARLAAERTAYARDEVLAVVSHDLRNPLNTIQLACSMLEQGTQLEKNVRLVRRAVRQMQGLIDDLLDAASIRASRMKISAAALDVQSLLNDIGDSFAAEAAERGIRLSVEAPENATIEADGRRLSQTLSNLINNALKFTSAGGDVRVRFVVEPTYVRFEVIDTGRGIAEDELDKVFDREWQSDETAHLGSGMGLYIAKGIVAAHGGELHVQSKLGQGSTFWFELPLGGPRQG